MTATDKPTRRRRREVELPGYLSACRRMLRGAGRRVGAADPEDLAALVQLRAELDDVIQAAVDALREDKGPQAPGYSWAQLGTALGMTRQSAQQRYGRRTAA